VDSLLRGFGLLERTLHVGLPAALLERAAREIEQPADPAALLEPGGGALPAGALLPDALPLGTRTDGALLALRFDPVGAPREAIVWRHARAAWHPVDLGPALPSPAAAARDACEAALDSGLHRIARARGEAVLAAELAVPRDVLADWLLDTRSVPERYRAMLGRLAGTEGRGDLLAQDWEAAARAAGAALRRGDLVWPGAVVGWVAEGRGDAPGAAAGFAAALGGLDGTGDLALRFARPGEPLGRVLAQALARSHPAGAPVPDAARAALGGWAGARAAWLAASDAARAAGRHGEAWDHALRAGWHVHRASDMDDVLGRLAEIARAAGSRPREALARLHLAAWTAGARGRELG
jgi:hypothetical protein